MRAQYTVAAGGLSKGTGLPGSPPQLGDPRSSHAKGFSPGIQEACSHQRGILVMPRAGFLNSSSVECG